MLQQKGEGNMRSKLWVVVALVLVVSALVGCGAAEPAAEPTAAPTKESAGPAALTIKGMVDKEVSLSIDDLKALGTEEITAENSKGESETNEAVRLSKILDQAGVKDGAKTLVLTADDGYATEVAVAELNADCHIKFRSKGGISSVMPGLPGNTWVKGVVTLELK
jgi:DMSO/TMAO reductase YedYZ molybdopterin-dependent catalytic subunit